jgi:plastocyanin
MRSVRLSVLAALALVVAACSSSGAATWTYAPAPSVTPIPSTAPSGSATASGSPAASGAPSASPSAATSPGASGTVLVLKAQNVAFDPAALQAPANQAFQIDFDNEDAGTPHNVMIKDASGKVVFDGGTPFPGVAHKTYSVPALAAGTYGFSCIVHPNMTGNITVE